MIPVIMKATRLIRLNYRYVLYLIRFIRLDHSYICSDIPMIIFDHTSLFQWVQHTSWYCIHDWHFRLMILIIHTNNQYRTHLILRYPICCNIYKGDNDNNNTYKIELQICIALDDIYKNYLFIHLYSYTDYNC